MNRRENQRGFSVVRGLLLVAAVGIIGIGAWYVWRQSTQEPAKAVNSFETCVAAGNPVMLSYPEQCAANGKTYIKSEQTPKEPDTTISQGVKGTITIKSGNCMPTVGIHQNSCLVGTYTTPSEVVIKRPIDLSNKENKEVVKKIDNVEGHFEAELNPGLYNMYVIYKGQEYCNSYGGQKGEDCEFTVEANEVTNYTLKIEDAVH